MGPESGRTFLVTGGNTGIGLATAMELARRGGRVYVACRSEARGSDAVAAIVAETGNAEVSYLPLDLADLASVRACADEFLATGQPLHVLVNNAGLGGRAGVTRDGFEMLFGVNHLGHFAFTTALLDRLVASAPARVVIAEDEAMLRFIAVETLRDEGFVVFEACDGADALSVLRFALLDVLRVQNFGALTALDQLFQFPFPLNQWHRTQILAVEPHQVECEKYRSPSAVQEFLELTAPVFIEADDLAVQDRVLGFQFRQRFTQALEAFVHVLMARHETATTVFKVSERAEAVML